MKYVSGVVDSHESSSENFQEIQDVLNRYRTLDYIHGYLMEEELDIVSSNKFQRTRWKKQQKVDEDALLNLNNDISSMQNELSSFQILSEDKQRARIESK